MTSTGWNHVLLLAVLFSIAIVAPASRLLTQSSKDAGCKHNCGGCPTRAACTGGNGKVLCCWNTPRDMCVNMSSPAGDPSNCGGCGVQCSTNNIATLSCVSGVCNGACEPGFADCDANKLTNGCEVNIVTDANNCGVCGNKCALPNAVSACSSGACAIASCNPGFADCDGRPENGCEVNLASDPANCNACGAACSGNDLLGAATCVAGVCKGTCAAGYADCDANMRTNGCEVSLKTDATNCGACGNKCALPNAVSTCSNGGCIIASCNPGFSDCDGNPGNGCEVSLKTDAANCGTCGKKCALPNAVSACSDGGCIITSCNAGFADCDGRPENGCEVNLASDPANCNACGAACSSNELLGASTCVAGICKGTCATGYADCDANMRTNGCEVSLKTDAANCGACGNKCALPNAVSTCSDGGCVIASCNPGFSDCDGKAENGCEVDLTSDTANCNACSAACSTEGLRTVTCSAGACGGLCQDNYADCNDKMSDGCEVHLLSDANNCGACGTKCSLPNAVSSCSSGVCVIASCNLGFSDCDGIAENGCEVDLTSDPSNCNACGAACSDSNVLAPACSAGLCSSMCRAGFADCDGNKFINGCEVNTNTDSANCGACGKACNLPNAVSACFGGSCAVVSCNPGYADCDGLAENGCEANLNSDTKNCGSCNNTCAYANAAPTCSAGVCAMSTCNDGFFNCDSSTLNGCEKPVNISRTFCTTCGTVCKLANAEASCDGSGKCVIASCNPGYLNCNKADADGCEVQADSCPTPPDSGYPNCTTTGKDPFNNISWVVCESNSTYVWISWDGKTGGKYHPLWICNSLGYSKLLNTGAAGSGKCGQFLLKYTCPTPGPKVFDHQGNVSSPYGYAIWNNVMWECGL